MRSFSFDMCLVFRRVAYFSVNIVGDTGSYAKFLIKIAGRLIVRVYIVVAPLASPLGNLQEAMDSLYLPYLLL